MADPQFYKLPIEDPGSPDIQADVPETQVLRDPVEMENTEVYTPVFKVTKNETTFTKGDIKLQKVIVSEEVKTLYLNPNYSEIQGDVIPTQPVRERVAAYNAVSKTEREPKPKPRTKIPIKKFKETVNKVSDRSTPEGRDGTKMVSETPTSNDRRRSSIPKLKLNNHTLKTNPPLADEEFDKMFEDIIENNDIQNEILEEAILQDTSVEDPVSLDHSFDEILEAYEENKLEPIELEKHSIESTSTVYITEDTDVLKPVDTAKVVRTPKATEDNNVKTIKLVKQTIEPTSTVDVIKTIDVSEPVDTAKVVRPEATEVNNVKTSNAKSRIPLGRFKSVQEVKLPKGSERRRSLKSVVNDDITKAKNLYLADNERNDKLISDRETREKEAKAEHKKLVRNILKPKDAHIYEHENSLSNDSVLKNENKENNATEKTVEKNNKVSVENEDKVQSTKDEQTTEHIVIDGNLVQYNTVKNQNVTNKIESDEVIGQINNYTNGDVDKATNECNKDYKKIDRDATQGVRREYLETYPKSEELQKKENVSAEGKIRLKKLVNQFDDVSYKDQNRQTEMDPMNTPIDNKIPFDDMQQRSVTLVLNAAGALKENKKDTEIKISGDAAEIPRDTKRKYAFSNNVNTMIEAEDEEKKKLKELNIEEVITRIPGVINSNHTLKTKQFETNNDLKQIRAQESEKEEKSEVKIPKNKSVLSKIAIFEKKEPIKHQLLKQPKPIAVNNLYQRPRIVNEVLKTRVLRQKSEGGDILRTEDATISTEDHYQVSEVTPLGGLESTVDNIHKSYKAAEIENVIENKQNVLEFDDLNQDMDTGEFKTDVVKTFARKPLYKSVENINKQSNETFKPGHTRSKENLSSKIKKHEERNIIERPKLVRAKSLADIELGDALVGKVGFVIKNINIEKERDIKIEREVINIRERPRSRSVADKIAIFEKKLIPIDIEDPKLETQIQAAILDSEKQDGVGNARETDQEVRKKIDDLITAKLRYKRADSMPFVKLNDGSKMPVLALGTASLDKALAKYVVAAAIDLGYRAIDTAYIHGNETEVGEGIRSKIADGTVKREDLFITSKLWSTFHRPDLVELACRDTLAALGLEYLDLFIIHCPMSFKEGPDPLPKIANVLQYSQSEYLDAWRAMEVLKSQGLVKSIGVANFNADQVDRVIEKGRVKPAVNQVESHPYLSQRRLAAHCRARGVALSCYGILGFKAENNKNGFRPAIDDATVLSVAGDLGVSPARVLIRYQLEKGHAVVVESSSSAHLRDALEAQDLKLTDHEVELLDGLNRNMRNHNYAGMGETHRDYPFKKAF